MNPQPSLRTASCGQDTIYYRTAKSYLGDSAFGGIFFSGPGDYVISPFVSYDISSEFSSNVNGPVYFDSTYTFTTQPYGLLGSRVFNRRAFFNHFSGLTDHSMHWDFGDGSPMGYGDTVNHSFAAGTNGVSVSLQQLRRLSQMHESSQKLR